MTTERTNDLASGYRSLRLKMKSMVERVERLQARQRELATPKTGLSARVQAVLEGRDTDGLSGSGKPLGELQLVARAMQTHSEKAMEICVADLEDAVDYLRTRGHNATDDSLRTSLVRRTQEITSHLPDTLKPHAASALMHIEHERLARTYTNDATMSLSEPLSSINREDFFVTEDNYAWDLSELVQAIAANGGVMRNPLSREMFTAGDVRGILARPQGRVLVPLQAAQRDMAMGVRVETIKRLEMLARVMSGERERTQMGTRKEMDEFQAYVASLPEREQETIEAFRCPAVDSYTGQAYDGTIGQTVRDVKATELCVHKAGDFIGQAAAYLRERQKTSKIADAHEEKECVVM